jgi:hypothetical protein
MDAWREGERQRINHKLAESRMEEVIDEMFRVLEDEAASKKDVEGKKDAK